MGAKTGTDNISISKNKASKDSYITASQIMRKEALKLEEIEKEKEELAKAKTDRDNLFTLIAHDLKNSFSALLGTSSILLEEYAALSDREKLYLISEFSKASQKSFNLFENMLIWAKSGNPNFSANFEDIDLNGIIEESVELHQYSAAKKKINILNNIPSGSRIFAEKTMLSSVIRNLINNSIKFTGAEGQITINFISCESSCDITVTDTGIGMSQGAIVKILGSKICYTTIGTDGEAGSGLGLKMGREFIERMGGQMLIESNPGSGSKFILRFPKRRI